MDELRAEFPVLERLAYLNAGSSGPVPRRAVAAAEASLHAELERGRADKGFVEEALARAGELRARVAALLACDPGELALTGSTTDGVNAAIAALGLGPGDEVLTSDEEHPGVLAPLAAGRARAGFEVRVVPFDEVPAAVSPRTRLVACSHVSWVTGGVLDAAALRSIETRLLLDGAQGLGAVPVDVGSLGCDFYAASGQKWLCGPNGLGYLYVRRELAAELLPPWPGYGSLTEAGRALDLPLHEDARRFDMGFPPPAWSNWALAALDTLEEAGIGAVQERAAALAARLADRLAERGLRVARRGPSTLVSWESSDAERDVERLRGEGMVLRHLPGRPYVRASVGAWSSEEELERLATLAGY